ncbi:MAG: DUF4124 domain-containing protein [Sinobacteraceae bacterium]|nr:DUF4124 domain-containing protein [Nevskiaceae bacterium]
MRPLACLFLLGLGFAAAAADVYRWVDKDGVVHYSDKPPTPDAQPAQLPPLQTYKAGAPPEFSATAEASATPAPAPTVKITAPPQEATIRDAEGRLDVAVAAQLEAGEGIVYYLDGTPVNPQPTPSTTFVYTGIERGEHQVAAALVGADGRVLARSAPVTIYMKPPMVPRHH